MGSLIMESAYGSPIQAKFRARCVLSSEMTTGIRRAFVMSPGARLKGFHDFGLEKLVKFVTPDVVRTAAEPSLPTHVIVISDRGGECVLSLYPFDDHYQCIVTSGKAFCGFISAHVGSNYSDYALTSASWTDEFHVPGLLVLHCDTDGEFAGLSVGGCRLVFDGTVPDTTSQARLSLETSEAKPQEALNDSSFLRLFNRLRARFALASPATKASLSQPV